VGVKMSMDTQGRPEFKNTVSSRWAAEGVFPIDLVHPDACFCPHPSHRRRERQDTVEVGAEARRSQTRMRVSARTRVIGGERDKTPLTCHTLWDVPPSYAEFLHYLDCAA